MDEQEMNEMMKEAGPLMLAEHVDEPKITLPASLFFEMVNKCAKMDILTDSLRNKGEVSDDIVWAITGASPEKVIEKLKKDSNDHFNWYWREKTEKENLQKQVDALKKEIEEMQMRPEPEVTQDE